MWWEPRSAGHCTHQAPREGMAWPGSPPCPGTAGPTRSSKGDGKISAGRSHAAEGSPLGQAARDNGLGGQQQPPGKQRLGRSRGVELGFARPQCSPRTLWPGGKQRGLGRDVPEPRYAVNSRHRSSNSSAGSQRWAVVGWKPDGAQPSTSAVPPATAPSQA